MYSAKELKAQMVRRGFTQERLAKEIGISIKTLNLKIKSGNFKLSEVQAIANALELEDVNPIFFAEKVTLKVAT